MAKILRKIIERKFVRYDLHRPGMLRFEGGHLHPCFVIDISEGGSRLMVGAAQLPEFFELLLTLNGTVKRDCRLVWRRRKECGVEFLREFDTDPRIMVEHEEADEDVYGEFHSTYR